MTLDSDRVIVDSMNLPPWYAGAAEGHESTVADENNKSVTLYVIDVQDGGNVIFWSSTRYGKAIGCSPRPTTEDLTYGAAGRTAKRNKIIWGYPFAPGAYD